MLLSLDKKLQLFQKWCEAVKRPDIKFNDRRRYVVCTNHFSSADKFHENRNRTNLKYGSVPSLYLPGGIGGSSKSGLSAIIDEVLEAEVVKDDNEKNLPVAGR